MRRILTILLLFPLALLFWLAIAGGALLWVVFTPERLTPIVQHQLDRHMPYESSVQRVELSLFSTFPQLSLQLQDLCIVSPFGDAPSDTLLYLERLNGAIDTRALRQEGNLVIRQFVMRKGYLNLYTDSLGQSNFHQLLDAFSAEPAEPREADLSLPLIELEQVRFDGLDIHFEDRAADLHAVVRGLTAGFGGRLVDEHLGGHLLLEDALVSLQHGDIRYLDNARVKAEIPAEIDTATLLATLTDASFSLDETHALLSGSVQASDGIHADLLFRISGLSVNEVVRLTPPSLLAPLGAFEAEGMADVHGHLQGTMDPSLLPRMDMTIRLANGTLRHEWVPQPLSRLNGTLRLHSEGGENARMDLELVHLEGRSPRSAIKTSGTLEDLMADVRFALVSDVDLQLGEWKAWLPQNMDLHLDGRVTGRANTRFSLSQALNLEVEKMGLSGQMAVYDLDFHLDTIGLSAGRSQFDFRLPNTGAASEHLGFAGLSFRSGQVDFTGGRQIQGSVSNLSLQAETADIRDTARVPSISAGFGADALWVVADTIDLLLDVPSATIRLSASPGDPREAVVHLEYANDGMRTSAGPHALNTGYVRLETDLRQDSSQEALYLQWLANGFVELYNGRVATTFLPYPVEVPAIAMHFDPETFNIYQSYFRLDQSDFGFSGVLNNVLSFARGDSLLVGDFRFESDHTDLAQLMGLTSGLGTEEAAVGQIPEQSVTPGGHEHSPGEFPSRGEPGSKPLRPEEAGPNGQPGKGTFAGPYMVPQGMDLNLEAFVRQATLGLDTIVDIRGDVRVSDGILVLDGLTFTTPAADMQLTAMYRTPRKNHLYLGIDYHMLDVDISRLLEMIPDIDTLMPMLRSFEGSGEFHLAVETYLDSLYNIKMSTLRGAASIRGQDLVLMDGETFAEIARTLRFTRRAENRVDSLAAEFTIFREEIDVYPFLIVMDRYQAVVGGRHNFDMSFNYHISVVDSPLPFRLGVDVSGTMDNLNYRVTSARYAELYRPVSRRAVQSHQLELRRIIREALITNIQQ